MAKRSDQARRKRRQARRSGVRIEARGTIGLFERLLLAAVSLIFISVFAITYMHTDRTRPAPPFHPVAQDKRLPGDRFSELSANIDRQAAAGGQTPQLDVVAPIVRATASGSLPTFTICHTGGGTNCVVDGDTAWVGGEKIRIADIDAPETHPPRCEHEASLGDKATRRLAELMNAGPFDLEILDRDTDRYGRKLRILVRDGRSIGDQLVAEGLARTWEGRRRPWC